MIVTVIFSSDGSPTSQESGYLFPDRPEVEHWRFMHHDWTIIPARSSPGPRRTLMCIWMQ